MDMGRVEEVVEALNRLTGQTGCRINTAVIIISSSNSSNKLSNDNTVMKTGLFGLCHWDVTF